MKKKYKIFIKYFIKLQKIITEEVQGEKYRSKSE